MKIECGVCSFEQDIEIWIDGECVKCRAPYRWEEEIAEDFSDSWFYVIWEDRRATQEDRNEFL